MKRFRPTIANVRLEVDGKRYRVCLHRGGRALGVWRRGKERLGLARETGLDLDGPTARRLIALAEAEPQP